MLTTYYILPIQLKKWYSVKRSTTLQQSRWVCQVRLVCTCQSPVCPDWHQNIPKIWMDWESGIFPSDFINIFWWLMLSMIFDPNRFPGYILSEHTKASDQTTTIDLSSFNLNLGDFGSARLVATLTPGPTVEQSTISVILSNVNDEDCSLSISCSLLVVNEHGEQISKVFFNICYEDRYSQPQ